MQGRLILTIAVITLLWSSCMFNNEWTAEETILLGKVTPIGIAQIDQDIWISDGNNNRLVRIDPKGAMIGDPIDIERPMHIGANDGMLYIPSYGIDKILRLDPAGDIDTVAVGFEMDAPAAVDVNNDYIAIADFYNHRVLINSGDQWTIIGGKGKKDGEMHYPTDLQLLGDKLFVADAYNNRGQVFSLDGTHILTFGEDLNFNAATGIFVTEEEIFLTDFENDRVVIFDHLGEVVQIIEEGLSSPADVTIIDGDLWILNFAGKYISKLKK